MSWKDFRILELEKALQESQRDSRIKDEQIQLLEDKVDDYKHRSREHIAKIDDCEKTLKKHQESIMDFQDQLENLEQQQQDILQHLRFRLDRINQPTWDFNKLNVLIYFVILLVYYMQRRDHPEQ